MSFVIQASRYSKIFCIRDWQQKCLANPALIAAATKPGEFKVTVPRSAGAVTLAHMVPISPAQLLPRVTTIHHKGGHVEKAQTRISGDDELRNLVPWLTGGPDGQQYMETDRFGIVELPVAADWINLLAEYTSQEAMLALYPERAEEVEAYRKEIQLKMRTEMQTAMGKAVGLADERVLRAIKSVYKNFYEQNRTNLENGAGRVSPTDAEKLVAYFLSDVIAKRNEGQKDLMDKVRTVMNHNVVGG